MKNKELGKLVQFAYDLRKDEYDWGCLFPTYCFYRGCYMDYGVRTTKGGVFVRRGYNNHSDCTVSTSVGVFEGSDDNPTRAFMLSTNNRELEVNVNPLELDHKTGYFDYIFGWYKYTDEERKQFFIEAMEMIGFNREDVIAVINGTMTAREAFQNVAPDTLKNWSWVSFNRKYFEFDGNIAIKGSFDGIHLDDFPFPFEEQPLMDCSKVKIACASFDENKRRVKLINLGDALPDAIIYTDLRMAIIDEPIDLAKVNASYVKFGHHKVINLDKSIASLDTMNFALAVDLEGKRFPTDAEGHLLGIEPLEVDNTTRNNKKINVYANVCNREMAEEAIQNEANGIGLVRTEDIYNLNTLNELKEFLNCLNRYEYYEDDSDCMVKFKELLKKQLEDVASINGNQRLIVRLFDFKLPEFLRMTGASSKIPNLRGACFLYNYDELLKRQMDVILRVKKERNVAIEILIPFVESSMSFLRLREMILNECKSHGISDIRIGAMIETKDMAMNVEDLAKYADFIAIGTNDLTESTTGLSRETKDEAFKILSNDVKTIIKDVIYRARVVNPNIEIGICGEQSNYMDNVLFYGDLNIDYVTCGPEYIKMNKDLLNDKERATGYNSQVLKRALKES